MIVNDSTNWWIVSDKATFKFEHTTRRKKRNIGHVFGDLSILWTISSSFFLPQFSQEISTLLTVLFSLNFTPFQPFNKTKSCSSHLCLILSVQLWSASSATACSVKLKIICMMMYAAKQEREEFKRTQNLHVSHIVSRSESELSLWNLLSIVMLKQTNFPSLRDEETFKYVFGCLANREIGRTGD